LLWTILVVLLVLWLLGMVSSYTVGGYIHVLLVIALAIAVDSYYSGRPTSMKRLRCFSDASDIKCG
jgi:hypothetical protein